MKKYEKPALEIVKLRVEEDIAATAKTTIYQMALGASTKPVVKYTTLSNDD